MQKYRLIPFYAFAMKPKTTKTSDYPTVLYLGIEVPCMEENLKETLKNVKSALDINGVSGLRVLLFY